MKIEEEKNYKLKEVALILGVSKSILRNWDNEDQFVAGRTPGSHRIYSGKQILEMKEKMFKKKENK